MFTPASIGEMGLLRGSSSSGLALIHMLHIISRLREEFDQPGAYHPTKRNCNTFSDALCQMLIGEKIPSW